MKKVFISQPMKWRSDSEILATRQRALDKVQDRLGEEVELIESFFQAAPTDAKPLWFLGKSLQMMSQADLVFFAEGWQNMRGCRIEHQCAVDYGIETMYE